MAHLSRLQHHSLSLQPNPPTRWFGCPCSLAFIWPNAGCASARPCNCRGFHFPCVLSLLACLCCMRWHGVKLQCRPQPCCQNGCTAQVHQQGLINRVCHTLLAALSKNMVGCEKKRAFVTMAIATRHLGTGIGCNVMTHEQVHVLSPLHCTTATPRDWPK